MIITNFIIENVMNLMKQIFLVTHITRKTTIESLA